MIRILMIGRTGDGSEERNALFTIAGSAIAE
jgi:hypothetical protein